MKKIWLIAIVSTIVACSSNVSTQKTLENKNEVYQKKEKVSVKNNDPLKGLKNTWP